MKSFLEFITEVFDTAYPFTLKKKGEDSYKASFRTDGGQSGEVDIRYLKSGIFYHGSHYYLDFSIDDSQDITGKGDAFKIFSTVLKVLENFASQVHPDVIVFTSLKPGEDWLSDVGQGSREKLYDTLVKRFASKLGYSFKKSEHDQWAVYTLEFRSR